jgi:uncharacterized protein YfaP (DUF2135 family)
VLVLSLSCEKEDEVERLIGQDGNPRFNLVFDNHENVDLDLYVQTPSGDVINFYNYYADGGELDVDCKCVNCDQGPNENIFWENGTAPSGVYKYWVDYYENCGEPGAASNFTVRVIRNGVVLEKRKGRLSSGSSQVWTHIQ